MREDQPPSSPKKQQIFNKQKLRNYVDSKTSTSRKPKTQSKFQNMPESRKQQMRKIIKDLRKGQEDDDSMAKPEVYVLSGRLPVKKKQFEQIKQPEKPQQVVIQHSQRQTLLKGGEINCKNNEKFYQTLQDKYQQSKPQKKQKVNEEQKPSSLQYAAQYQEILEKIQVQQPEKPYEFVVQHSQPQALLKWQSFTRKSGGSFLNTDEQFHQTLQNKFQQAKPQRKQNIHDLQRLSAFQQAAQNHEGLRISFFSPTQHKMGVLSISQTLHAMLANQLQKHKSVLEKFMFDFSPHDPHTKTLKENTLAKLLEKVFIKKIRDLTLEIQSNLRLMADQLCKSLLDSLSQQENQEYLILVNQYNKKYEKNKQAKLNKLTKSFMLFMMKQPMTPYVAIKIDLLSYFLRNNIEYEIQYGKMHTDAVTPSILAKILTFDKEDIDRLRATFEDKWSFVSLENYGHFKDLIILATLVAIRQKVEHNEQKKYDRTKQGTPQLSKYTRAEQGFTFKFSQLAFQTEGMSFRSYCTSKRIQIIQICKKIVDLKSQGQQKKLIVSTKSKYTIMIKQLINLIIKIKHHRQQFNKQYQEQMRLQQGLYQLPWYFYSPKSQRLKNILKKLSECKICQYQIYQEDNFFATVLCKILVQRMKQLSELVKSSVKCFKWSKKYTENCDFIFVHRLDYSYNRMHNLQGKDDLVLTLIMGTSRGRIIFIKFVEKNAPLTDEEYGHQLQTIFDQKLKIGIKFGLLLYQLSISRQFDMKEYAQLRKHFWWKHRAIVLLTANPSSHFQLHQVLDLHIKIWAKDKKISKQTFFKRLKAKIVLTARAIVKLGADYR